jgi:KamA family protein
MAHFERHNSTGKTRPRIFTRLDQVDQLSDIEKARLSEVTKWFAFRVNDYYLKLINWNDPQDPIRRLIIPHLSELNEWGEMDACNENSITVKQGVQHKYGSTVLLLVTEMCASFCRYCFRKRIFIEGERTACHDLTEGMRYIREHPEVDNVLLTGGDPLILSTKKIDSILSELRQIEHVRVIRIGSKLPAFNPYRFLNDPELLEVFEKHSLPDSRVYLVCHFDHPRELTPESREVLRQVQKTGVICVNQSPIIKGVSDDVDVLRELFNELSYIGVPQYYVFQNRPTSGNEPYAVPIVEAYYKIEEAKRACSGLAKRLKYVMSHESGKVEIVGVDHQHIYLRYHRAKFDEDEQRFLVCYRNDDAYWLDQLEPLPGYRNDFYEGDVVHFAS